MRINLIQIGPEGLESVAALSPAGTRDGGDFALKLAALMDVRRAAASSSPEAGLAAKEISPKTSHAIGALSPDSSQRNIIPLIIELNHDQHIVANRGDSARIPADVKENATKFVAAFLAGEAGGNAVIRLIPSVTEGAQIDSGVEILVQISDGAGGLDHSATVQGDGKANSVTISGFAGTETDKTDGSSTEQPVLVLYPDMSDPRQVEAIRQLFSALNLITASSPPNGGESAADPLITGSTTMSGAQIPAQAGANTISDAVHTAGIQWPRSFPGADGDSPATAPEGKIIPSAQSGNAPAPNATAERDASIFSISTTLPDQKTSFTTTSNTSPKMPAPDEATPIRIATSLSITPPAVSAFNVERQGNPTPPHLSASETESAPGKSPTTAAESMPVSYFATAEGGNQAAGVSPAAPADDALIAAKSLLVMEAGTETNRISGVGSSLVDSAEGENAVTVDASAKSSQSPLYNIIPQGDTAIYSQLNVSGDGHLSSGEDISPKERNTVGAALPLLTVLTPDGEAVKVLVRIQLTGPENSVPLVSPDTFSGSSSTLSESKGVNNGPGSAAELSPAGTADPTIAAKASGVMQTESATASGKIVVIAGRIIRETLSPLEMNAPSTGTGQSADTPPQTVNTGSAGDVLAGEGSAPAAPSGENLATSRSGEGKAFSTETISMRDVSKKTLLDPTSSPENVPLPESAIKKDVPAATLSENGTGASAEEKIPALSPTVSEVSPMSGTGRFDAAGTVKTAHASVPESATSRSEEPVAAENPSPGQPERLAAKAAGVGNVSGNESSLHANPVMPGESSDSGKANAVLSRDVNSIPRTEIVEKTVQINRSAERIAPLPESAPLSSRSESSPGQVASESTPVISGAGDVSGDAPSPADYSQADKRITEKNSTVEGSPQSLPSETASGPEAPGRNARNSMTGESKSTAPVPTEISQSIASGADDPAASPGTGESASVEGSSAHRQEVNGDARTRQAETAFTLQAKSVVQAQEPVARPMDTFMPGTARKIHFVSPERPAGASIPVEREGSGEGNALKAEIVSPSPRVNTPTRSPETSGVLTDSSSAASEPKGAADKMPAIGAEPTPIENSNSERVLSSRKDTASAPLLATEAVGPSSFQPATATEAETITDHPASRIRGDATGRGTDTHPAAEVGGSDESTPARREIPVSDAVKNGVGASRNAVENTALISETGSATDVSPRNMASANPASVENTPKKSGNERRTDSSRTGTAVTAPDDEDIPLATQMKNEMTSAREERIEKRIQLAEHRTAESRFTSGSAAEPSPSVGAAGFNDTSTELPSIPRPASDVISDTFTGEFRRTILSGGKEGEPGGGEDLAAMRATLEKSGALSDTKRNSGSAGSIRRLHDSSEFEAGILNSVVRQARFMLQRGQSSATITLEPPSLGKLKLEIVTENSKITGKIMVESREVQDIIRNNIADLRQSLSQGGLQVESFDVQVGHNGGTDNWARREDFESAAALLRASRESIGAVQSESAASGLQRGRNMSSGLGYIDMWM